MPDRKLQEIVHKIFPWMKAQEEEEERNFYLRRGIELKPEYQQSQQTEAATPGVIVGTTHKKNKRNYDARVDESAVANTTMSMVAMNDQIDVQLDPDITPPHPYQQLPPLRNARIGISGRAKINTLKKYLIMKLGLKDTSISTLSSKVVSSTSSPTMIELTCNGDTMDDELTLTYILRTKWLTSNKVLTLKYRLLHQVEEEEKKKKGKK